MTPKSSHQNTKSGYHRHIALSPVTLVEMPLLLLSVHPATLGAECFLKSPNLSTDVQLVKFPDATKLHLSLFLDKSHALPESAAVGT
jgi:hypothetical protein